NLNKFSVKIYSINIIQQVDLFVHTSWNLISSQSEYSASHIGKILITSKFSCLYLEQKKRKQEVILF
ncbi:hypothetical protein, partial [Acinetobacter radioresistens]|uniref:hypothetical protein n=1 Tax=Acinetobacter radioresistens TaxID=40216 RepID=UPI001D0EB112